MREIFFLDWGNRDALTQLAALRATNDIVHCIPIGINLTTTIKECAAMSVTDYFWVISSLTDYSNFDFTWHPDQYTAQYSQVLGHSTWLLQRDTINQLSASLTDIHDIPDKHFVNLTNIQPIASPLDIVYISNGEPKSELNWQHLLAATRGYPNRIVRIKDITGRTAAYQAAAMASNTAWFFAVFAKLEINPSFDWYWQPDVMHGAKHWIFTAKNPVNDLEYGHMAMILYNKFLTLDTVDSGLDFVMSRPCMLSPVSSGIARFNQNPITTWRTAFREVLKLRRLADIQPTPESNYRLNTWLTKAEGSFAAECLCGAANAMEYYDSINGDYELLKLSFDWKWLDSYYEKNARIQ